MEFGILGPLEVRAGGVVVALGGPKPRALLAVLLLHANETGAPSVWRWPCGAKTRGPTR